MQIKTIMRYYFYLPNRQIFFFLQFDNTIYQQDYGERGTLAHCWQEFKLVQSKWRTIWQYQNYKSWDFSDGPVVKNPPCNAGDTGSIPGQGTKIPHAMGHLSLPATTTELTLFNQSSRAANYRVHAPWSPHTTTREEKNPHATTREKSSRLNEEPTCRNERSRMPQQQQQKDPACCN